MPWSFSSSALATSQVGTGTQLLDESINNLLTAALDEAKQKYSKVPMQGEKYYVVKKTTKNNITSQGVLGIGVAQVNPDGKPLPFQKQIIGFENTITSYVIRNAMAITRQAMDDDRYGVLGKHARALMQSGDKTVEMILADSFSRGFGTTNLALLCEDGLAMFSASHVNARASAGTWSNLDTTSTLTASRVAANRTSFRQYIDGNGDLAPQKLEKVVVSPDLENTIAEIVNTSLKVDTSLNNTNVVSGTKYEVYDWLTSGTVIYVGDGENELELHIRKDPEIHSWNDGQDPDVFKSRWRIQLGTGCGRPGKFRGCTAI